MTYAAKTEVPIERSRAEIERMLIRYGATAFQVGWEGDLSAVSFKIADRYVRVLMPMPERAEAARSETGRKRTSTAAERAYAQATRQRWRALNLIIKAKLEAVAAGITTVEREFIADIVLPNNATIGQWLAPQIAAAYASGKMPPLLPGGNE